MSLPKQALYTNKIRGSHARNYQSNIAPQNGQEYSFGETIIINVPTARNIVMSGADTLLKCTLNLRTSANDAVAALERGGIATIIQRLRMFHGSTLLTDIDNYGNLLSMLTSVQQSSDNVLGKLEILQGTSYQKGIIMNQTVLGDVSIDFNFNLLSILSLSNNYVPLFAMTGAPLRLELQLVSGATKILASTAAAVFNAHSTKKTLTNVELVCNLMELSEQGMDIVRKAAGPVVQWVVSDYRNYASNVVLGTSETQVSVPIPAKFNSLKSLFWSFREHSAGTATYFPNASCKFEMLEYTIRVGSQVIPSKAPNTPPEFYSELLRAIGSVSDTSSATTINKTSFYTDVPAVYVDAGISPAFYCGIDLESYSNSDMSNVYAGMNTSTDDIFFNPKFDAQGGATNIRIDTYALFDSLILFQDGQAQVQY